MASENIRSRVRRAVQESLWAMELDKFSKDNIVVRKQPVAGDLDAPAIVVSKGRVERLRSPAGMRLRTFEVQIAVYWKRLEGDAAVDRESQEEVIEQIMAAFDVPPSMPTPLTAIVPEAQELRVTNRDEFLEAGYGLKVDIHRFNISVEVCQAAGVAS